MKSAFKRPPRNEVISVRLTEERLKLLERYRKILSEQEGHDVSLAEAAFLVIDERAAVLDRDTERELLLRDPPASLLQIRKKWESQHALSLADWDVVSQYMQIATEEESQEPPLLWPAIPSRESYLALLEAFEAVYLSRKKVGSRHDWYYVRNLGGDLSSAKPSEESPEQRQQAVLKQIAARKQLLKSPEKWERPGTVAGCLVIAIRDEGIESERLDQVLASFWPALWGLAARAHWLRFDRKPLRPKGPTEDDFRRRILLPDSVHADEFSLSFTAVGCPELGVSIDLGRSRRLSLLLSRYPEIAEFQAMLEGWLMKRSWNGRHFVATHTKEKGGTSINLLLREQGVNAEFTEKEWDALRELLRKAWPSPELQRWLVELRMEYGEHG
ncbi:MAG TPA: hypothetical protein VGR55_10785 [Candidatus Acidoferrum sp.]|nr:hypothetical protein [Candidatus Acidoferrum sp.]